MATSTIPWDEIKVKWTQGQSQRSLEREYGVSQAAISTKAKKDGWQRLRDIPDIPPANESITDNDEVTTSALAEKLLRQIAMHLKNAQNTPLEAKDVKQLTDALSQIFKIQQLSAQADNSSENGIPADLLRYLSALELNQVSGWQSQIEAMLEVARERQLQAEPTNISSYRRGAQ